MSNALKEHIRGIRDSIPAGSMLCRMNCTTSGPPRAHAMYDVAQNLSVQTPFTGAFDPLGAAAAAVASLIAQFKYGEMFNFNTSTNVVITGANVWTQVGSGFSAGMLNGVTFQNAKELKIATAGVYGMWWSMSLNSLGANDNIEAGIMVNGAIANHTVSHSHLATANDNSTLGSQGFHSLVANDLVSLAVNNNSDGDDIVVEHANLLIARLPQ